MKYSFKLFSLTLLFAVYLNNMFAQGEQDLSFQLKKLGPQNVEKYLHPMINGYMADINSGIYHSAKTQDFLVFNLSLKSISIQTTNSDKKFNLMTPEFIDIKDPSSSGTVRLQRGLDYDEEIFDAPTVVGIIEHQTVKIKPQSTYYNAYKNSFNGKEDILLLPRGYSCPSVPLIIPQLTVGLPLGFEAMLRYLPTMKAMEVGDAGKCSFTGYGLRFDISRLIPLLPLDAAIHFAKQQFRFKSEKDEDIFSVEGTAYGVELGKNIWIFTFYGGYQIESASFTLNQLNGSYKTFDGTANPFTIPEQTFNAKNKSRVTIGFGFSLLFANVNAEYNFTSIPVFVLGLGITLR